MTNDRSKDLNRTDEVDPESEVSDEVIEACLHGAGRASHSFVWHLLLCVHFAAGDGPAKLLSLSVANRDYIPWRLFARPIDIEPGFKEDIALQLTEEWILGASPTTAEA